MAKTLINSDDIKIKSNDYDEVELNISDELKEKIDRVTGGDTLPYGSIVDYNGTTVPDGYVQVSDPNDYSTTEQVIGTWIDNKPLYRKVLQLTLNGSAQTLDISSWKVGTIFFKDGVLNSNDGTKYKFPYHYGNTTEIYTTIEYKNGILKYRGANNDYSKGTVYVIIEYTKSTD